MGLPVNLTEGLRLANAYLGKYHPVKVKGAEDVGGVNYVLLKTTINLCLSYNVMRYIFIL